MSLHCARHLLAACAKESALMLSPLLLALPRYNALGTILPDPEDTVTLEYGLGMRVKAAIRFWRDR